MATVSARDFNRDVSAAKRAAIEAPLVITDRGEPAFVLLSIDEYRRLNQSGHGFVDFLSMDQEVEFEAEKATLGLKVAEL